MPTTSSPARSSASRFIWLAVAIVAAIVAWTVAWHMIAARIETATPQTLSSFAGNDARAECANAIVRGYPFRFGLFCDRLTYSNQADGLSANAGAFRSAAQFYRPSHIVSELDGPLVISSPRLSGSIDWQGLQMSTNATPNGLQRGSLDAREFHIEMSGAAPGGGLAEQINLTIGRLTAHIRQNGDDVDIAAYGDAIAGHLLGRFDAKSLTIETTLSNQPGLLNAPFAWPEGAYEVRLHKIALALDEASSLELAGPVSVAADGLVSAALQLTVRDAGQLASLVTAYDAEAGKMISRFAPMLGALDTVPGDNAITLPLTIRNGAVSMGMIPLGQLAPL